MDEEPLAVEQEWVSIREAVSLFPVTRRFLYSIVKRNEVKFMRQSKQLFLCLSDLENFVERKSDKLSLRTLAQRLADERSTTVETASKLILRTMRRRKLDIDQVLSMTYGQFVKLFERHYFCDHL